MNCLEFRRAVLAGPRRPGAEASSHAEQCPSCKEFLMHSLEIEKQLAVALRVPVPHGLSARLLDRTVAARRSRWLALAASLLAAVAIALALGWPRSDAMALAGIEFKTPLGKVTLLLIPDRPLAAPAAGTAYGLKAAVLPAVTGSIVIIGESGRSIGRVETLLKSG